MEHYGTLAAAAAYNSSLNRADWADLSAQEQQAALVTASLYLDAVYGARYPGRRTNGASQLQGWPRTGAVTIDGHEIAADSVPLAVETATYEAAYRLQSAESPIIRDIDPLSVVKSETVGPVSVSYAVDAATVANLGQVRFAFVDALMSGVLTDPGRPSQLLPVVV